MESELDSITGCLLGTAIGEAMGLPFEGLTRRRVNKFFKSTGRD